MVPVDKVWLAWSALFLAPWAVLFIFFPKHRRAMLWSSFFTLPFALTEPLFVPEYWSPPSLFDLAGRTGFDIESFIFCFGIGGVGSVLYTIWTRRSFRPMSEKERKDPRHAIHLFAIGSPLAAFLLLAFLPWNPIYSGILSLLIGGLAAILCRPDLKTNLWKGGVLFLIYYFVFLGGLGRMAPGYFDEVWNYSQLTGLRLFGIPLEELLFGFSFGFCWSGIYEHFTWRTCQP